jgi:transposase InsO family protein
MTAQLVTDALVMAIWRRGKPDALLHHSDRGSQGGFKWSSQHPLKGSCDAKSKAAVGTGAAVLTWSPTGDRTRREPAVLGGDCGRYGE